MKEKPPQTLECEEEGPISNRDWNFELVKEIGPLAVRLLITINSGGILVLLTFFATITEKALFVLPLYAVKLALSALTAGIVFPLLMILISYANAARNSRGESLRWVSDRIISVNVFCISCSILSFMFAIAVLVYSFEPGGL